MGEELKKDGEHIFEPTADNVTNTNTGYANKMGPGAPPPGYTNGMGPGTPPPPGYTNGMGPWTPPPPGYSNGMGPGTPPPPGYTNGMGPGTPPPGYANRMGPGTPPPGYANRMGPGTPPPGYANRMGPGTPPPGYTNGMGPGTPPPGYANRMGPGTPPPPGYMNGGMGVPPYRYNAARPPQRRNSAISAERFKMFGIPVLIYAIVSAACLYNNWSSILSAVMAVVSIAFISVNISRGEKNLSADMKPDIGSVSKSQIKLIPYYLIILLLSVAVSLTDESCMIFGCNVGIILTEMYAVMSYYNETENHGIIKGIIAFFEMFFGAVEYMGMPFSDRRAEREKMGRKRNSKLIYVLLGCAIALPLLVIILNLLSSADPVFAKVIKDIFGKIFFSWDIVKIVLFAAVIFFFVYGFIVKAGRRDLGAKAPKEGTYEPVIGITITIVLSAFYLIFAVVQIIYLFMNSAGLPDDLTYAEYARRGFFQLLFVAVVNICIVLIFNDIFRKSVMLKTALVVMCVCTYIMIASSAVRLSMYIKEYDLTYLRINTIWALVVTTIIMTGVMVSMFYSRMPVFRFIFVTVMIMFALYAFVRPGAVIAKYNLEHASGDVDLKYVMDIGSDGVPYVVDYLRDKDVSADDDLREVFEKYGDSSTYSYYRCETVGGVLSDIVECNDDKGYVRGFNFSRYRATKIIKDYVR